MKPKIHNLLVALPLLALATLNPQLSTIFAQGTTAFTYQGRLNTSGGPATGSYDMTFAVYDAAIAGNFIAGPITNSAVAVSNGLFTVTLDFGAGVFTGTNYWVQMAVSTNGAGNFTTLVPRQQLTPAPYAISLVSPQATALNPAGAIIAFAGPTNNIPNGYLLCDGRVVSRATYPNLFAAIGTAWGNGDGSGATFNLPDARGFFLRGVDNGAGRDPDTASRIASGAIPGNGGDAVGSYQLDAFQGHNHNFYMGRWGINTANYDSTWAVYGENFGNQGSSYVKEAVSDGAHGTPRVSSETRPLNIYVNYIIKY